MNRTQRALLRSSRSALVCLALGLAAVAAARPAHSSVRKLLADELPALGHRNWIVIADSAYPLQTSAGVQTVTVTESQLDCVRAVLQALAHTHHVRPHILLDRELAYVPERNAPGISAYRKSLKTVLAGRATESLLHEDIIKKLDDAGKTFKVLLIKTPLTVPYTSVFFQLECGYWSDSAEQQLRSAMAKAGNKG